MNATPETGPTELGWDTTTDPMNPQPTIYPVCADCGEAWVYRRYLSLATGTYRWAWGKPDKVPRGCRHKSGPKRSDQWQQATP